MTDVTYALSGMHCAACVGRVTKALEPMAGSVEVSLNPQQVILRNSNVSFTELQNAVAASGKYVLIAPEATHSAPTIELDKTWLQTYRPLLMILGFITAGSLLIQIGQHAGHDMGTAAISWHDTMRYFMAGFFLVFAFFKLLDVSAFADAYASYDLLAARWRGWGLIYPFVELALGMAYLANVAPVATSWITLLVMGFSAIGVVRAVLTKTKIQCACLGTVFQLPMSTVTIVEDVGMVAMAGLMLLR
jgi:copper chaperone CopZ